jgi:hypothetical protein
MAVVTDIIPMAEVIEGASQGVRQFLASLTVSSWTWLGAGISAAAAVWFIVGHGSWFAPAVRNLLLFLYGIGVLM